MASHYQVQDLIEETPSASVHRAVGKDGRVVFLTQARLEPGAREALMKPGMFAESLAKLRCLKFEYLREVIDGGMEDSGLWIASHWLDAKPLSECATTEKDLQNLVKQFQDLLEYLGELAGAVDFNEKHILTMRSDEGGLACLFQIDYAQWFCDLAAGRIPGEERSGGDEAKGLITRLAIKQLQLPKVVRTADPIPFVDERSPALKVYPACREPWLGRIMFWGTLILGLAVIVWITAK